MHPTATTIVPTLISPIFRQEPRLHLPMTSFMCVSRWSILPLKTSEFHWYARTEAYARLYLTTRMMDGEGLPIPTSAQTWDWQTASLKQSAVTQPSTQSGNHGTMSGPTTPHWATNMRPPRIATASSPATSTPNTTRTGIREAPPPTASIPAMLPI